MTWVTDLLGNLFILDNHFSHLFETYFVKTLPDPLKEIWHHENLSCVILEEIVKNNPLINIDVKQLALIKAMITGNPLPNYPAFIFQIVHNKLFEIDVDKFDYLKRDCKHTGLTVSVDLDRLMQISKLSTTDDLHIEFPMKESFVVSELFSSRYSMYKKAYFHPVSGAIELMLRDIFKEYASYIGFDRLNEGITPETLRWYIGLDDTILNEIEKKFHPPLLSRLRHRDIYKLTNYLFIKTACLTEDVQETLKLIREELEKKELKGHVILTTRNWCKGKNNPLQEVKFTPQILPWNPQNVDSLMPIHFQEQVISVYAVEKKHAVDIKNAVEMLMEVNFVIKKTIGAIGQTKIKKNY